MGDHQRALEELLSAAGLVDDVVAVGWSPQAGRRAAAAAGTAASSAGSRSTDSVYYAASVTKQVIAVLAAQLVVDGRLRVDDPARRYLPVLPTWAGSVTIDHLVHHTAGLPVTSRLVSALGLARERQLTNASVLEGLSLLAAPDSPPGRHFAYSNVGYVVLAEVVQELSGTPLAALARDGLFTPLGMTRSQLGGCPAGSPPGHPPPRTIGDGGLWSSPDDLLIWLRALNENRWGERLTSLVQSRGRLADGTVIPYCWGMTARDEGGSTSYTHGGNWSGWAAKTVRNPTTATAVVVMSHGGNDPQTISDAGMSIHAMITAQSIR